MTSRMSVDLVTDRVVSRLRSTAVSGAIPIASAVVGLAIGQLLGQEGSILPILFLGASVAALSGMAVVVIRGAGDVAAARPFSPASAFRRELDRSRRHGRSFALVRLPLSATSPAVAQAGAGGDGIAAATFGLLGTTLRVTDLAWVDGDSILVLLPESDLATAEGFVDRARLAAPDSIHGSAGIALFPTDGLTSGALLEATERNLIGERPQPMVAGPILADTGINEVAIDAAAV